MTPDKYIYLHKPLASDEEIQMVGEAIRSGWIAPGGPYVERFEKELSAYTKSPYAVALQSGTAALHLILKALHIQEGDFVILPTHTFVATANPVLYEKAIPVLVDSDQGQINMSPAYLEEAIKFIISKYQTKPKAIITVHIYGIAAPLKEIKEIAEKYEIPLIEDAAESMGTFYEHQHTGTFGKFGILSFNGNKIISTSGGGAVLTHDKEKAEYIRFLSSQAKEPRPYYYHKEVGYNYQFSNLLAALGMAQIKKLPDFLQKKEAIHRYYLKHLNSVPVRIFKDFPGGGTNYWLNIMILDKHSPGEFIQFMEENGIETRHTWYPLHLMPLFEKYHYFGRNETYEFFRKTVLLPSGAGLTGNEMEYIIEKIESFFIKNPF